MATILRLSATPRPRGAVVVSLVEAAWLLGVSAGTVRLLLRDGRLATGDGTHGRHGTDARWHMADGKWQIAKARIGETASQRRGDL